MSEDIARDVERLRHDALVLGVANGPARWSADTPDRVLRVLAFLEDQSRLCVALAERCKAQAELLGKRAEKEGA